MRDVEPLARTRCFNGFHIASSSTQFRTESLQLPCVKGTSLCTVTAAQRVGNRRIVGCYAPSCFDALNCIDAIILPWPMCSQKALGCPYMSFSTCSVTNALSTSITAHSSFRAYTFCQIYDAQEHPNQHKMMENAAT